MQQEKAFLEQGKHEFRQGKYLAAIDSYKKACDRNPSLIEAYYGCGLAAEKLGKQTLARDCSAMVAKLKAESSENETIPRLSIKQELITLESQGDKSPTFSSWGEGILYFLLALIVLLTPTAILYIAEELSSHDGLEINPQIVRNFDNTL